MLLHELLRVVRAVERLAGAVLARARVIAAHDEVRAAVVLADDRVPHGLARTAHAHRERQQAQRGRLLGIRLHEMLVAAHAREVVDVARLRHADDRLDQQVRLDVLRRAERELLVRAMHRVARLERDDLAPAELLEAVAHLLRRVAQVLEVVVARRLDAAELAAEVDVVAAAHEIAHAGMRLVVRAEHGLRLERLVGAIDARDLHRRDQHAFAVAQRDLVADLELVGELGLHVEVDRHRPDHAGREPHVRQHGLVVLLVEEAFERRERAVEQHLDVADLAHVEIPRRQVARARLLGLHAGLVEIQILQLPSVGFFESSHCFPRVFSVCVKVCVRVRVRPSCRGSPGPRPRAVRVG